VHTVLFVAALEQFILFGKCTQSLFVAAFELVFVRDVHTVLFVAALELSGSGSAHNVVRCCL
jgi:hypothetical protein